MPTTRREAAGTTK
jgi:hypothetical protein